MYLDSWPAAALRITSWRWRGLSLLPFLSFFSFLSLLACGWGGTWRTRVLPRVPQVFIYLGMYVCVYCMYVSESQLGLAGQMDTHSHVHTLAIPTLPNKLLFCGVRRVAQCCFPDLAEGGGWALHQLIYIDTYITTQAASALLCGYI